MEDIIEDIIKGLARALLFISKILLILIWQGLCEKILWYIGWPVLKTLTLGGFPKLGITEIEKEGRFTQAVVVLIGLLIPFVLAFYIVQLLNNGT